MAVVGKVRVNVDFKAFDNTAQTWAVDYELAKYQAYAGQGFQTPVDQTWANRPTGVDGAGLVMGFPRSAEPQPPTPRVGRWYISES